VVQVAKLFPAPRDWWEFILTAKPSPAEFHQWVSHQVKNWKTAEGRTAAQLVQQWSRAALTHKKECADTSVLVLPVIVPTLDAPLLQWTVHSLGRYLPLPKPSPEERRPRDQGPAPAAQFSDHQAQAITNAVVLAQDVIKYQLEKSDRDRPAPKQIPEMLLCRLLGLCGLPWDERSELPAIWQKLYQQADKGAKEAVLRVFFQELGKKVPSFRTFHNSMLFEHIVKHKFEPGASYNTCHHGISLLSVSMRSHAAQEMERHDDDCFDQATTRTPEAVRKHTTKAPPALPTSIAELMQLLWRLIVVMEGLFTANCSLVRQLSDMHDAMQDQEQTIMGDPATMAEWLPQLAWAIISASRAFFLHISTREDVDPTERGTPRFAVANLSIYTSMFRAGLKLNLAAMPSEWRRKEPAQYTAPKKESSTAQRGSTNAEPRWGANPFVGSTSTAADVSTQGDNPKYPRCFATSDALKRVRELKGKKLTLTAIAQAAGIAKPVDLDTAGFPAGSCLNWIVMGNCQRKGCKFVHPQNGVDEVGATRLYKQLEPGLTRLLEKASSPGRDGPQ
jgi:hypothetical protein